MLKSMAVTCFTDVWVFFYERLQEGDRKTRFFKDPLKFDICHQVVGGGVDQITKKSVSHFCQAQVQSQIQVPNPGPKSKSQIQNPKSKGKGMGLGLTL